MSEFSESFHFPTSDAASLKAKLERAGLTGELYGPSSTGWITYVPLEGCPGFSPLASSQGGFAGKLSTIANLPALEYINCEDHMWSAMLWRDGQLWARYACEWDDDITVDTSEADVVRFGELPAAADASAGLERALAHKVSEDDLLRGEPLAYHFAKALGLPRYQWTSAMYLTADGGTDGGTPLQPR